MHRDRSISRAAALVVLALGATGCASSRATADWDEGDGPVRTYQVRFEVECERCTVNYTISGERMQQASARGVWRRTVRVTPLVRTSLRLSALASEGGPVGGVRILVDGEVVAEARGPGIDRGLPSDFTVGGRRPITVEAEVPTGRNRIVAGTHSR